MGYYEGIVCENAHKVARRVSNNSAAGTAFCDQCGAATHFKCPGCGKPIRGGETPNSIDERRMARADDKSWPTPWYCYGCGVAYPWTTKKIEAAKEIVAEVDGLTAKDRESLSASIPDLLSDTPRSDLAAMRWKQALLKLAGPAKEVIVGVITDIATSTIKRQMGL